VDALGLKGSGAVLDKTVPGQIIFAILLSPSRLKLRLNHGHGREMCAQERLTTFFSGSLT
jgi:hypothetical protein